MEDDDVRAAILQSWLPPDVRVVRAPTAGVALGVIRRDAGQVYAGVMLDHDLQEHAQHGVDHLQSGTDVADAIRQHFSPHIPVLIHSTNSTGGARMNARLQGSGFDVTRMRMSNLSRSFLAEWMEEVREIWQSLQEG